MNILEWSKILKKQIKFDHDYIPSFETTVQILSELLAERDRVYQMYEDTGSKPVVEFTTDRGAVNLKPNPLLRTWQDLNVTALAYLRDLGLTPAGLRKLQGQLPKDYSYKKDTGLGNTLEKLQKLTANMKRIEFEPDDEEDYTPQEEALADMIDRQLKAKKTPAPKKTVKTASKKTTTPEKKTRTTASSKKVKTGATTSKKSSGERRKKTSAEDVSK